MSARAAWATLFLASCALFAGLAAAFDRGALRPPPAAPARAWKESTPGEREEVLAAVTLFNKIYQDFYATGGDPRLIDAMPSSKEVKHQIFRDLGYLRDAGRILVVDEAQSLPVCVESDAAGNARATVYEEWNYVYQEPATRRPVTEIKGMGQGFLYTLKRGPEGWQITGWDPLPMERPEPREGFVW